jgi:hypothetical protein
MTNKRLRRQIYTPLLQRVPGIWTPTGFLLRLEPAGVILRAIAFDSSAYDADLFSPRPFVMPLYGQGPGDHVHLTFSIDLHRPRLGRLWEWQDESADVLLKDLARAVEEQAMPFLARGTTPEQMKTLALESLREAPRNWGILEHAARSALMAGQFDESARMLESVLDASRDADRDWEIGQRNDVAALLADLRESPAKALDVLWAKVEHTARALDVPVPAR